ncbi:MAG: glycerol-3-phosphate 1-O-acyltransferase PlsY [Candidatus Omnitrophota bacterium]|jgi:glycerol-3-phosphate acyltransferase PlsY
MLWIILAIATSYLLGSIPTAYIFGRLLKGVDIRKFGSGNVGATNALRLLGKRAGLAVLSLDMLKGILAVIFVADYALSKSALLSGDLLRAILGASCIFGHNWTIFLNFKGGKGVAATFGVLIGLAFKISGFNIILALVILVWLITFIIIRIVSLSSLLAGIALPVFMLLFRDSRNFSNGLVFFSLLITVFIFLRHRSNLKRLLRGKEPRLSFKKPA